MYSNYDDYRRRVLSNWINDHQRQHQTVIAAQVWRFEQWAISFIKRIIRMCVILTEVIWYKLHHLCYPHPIICQKGLLYYALFGNGWSAIITPGTASRFWYPWLIPSDSINIDGGAKMIACAFMQLREGLYMSLQGMELRCLIGTRTNQIGIG